MTDGDAGFLNVFLRQTIADADLECRLRLPLLVDISLSETKLLWHCLESGDKHAICQCLEVVSKIK